MSRVFHCIAFSAVVALLGLTFMLTPLGNFVEREFGLSWLFKLRGEAAPPPNVSIVGINSRSGPDMGLSRLPRNWPRSLHGVLVDRLAASKARTIIFDMDFNQPKEIPEDTAFADAIRAHGQVVLFERLEGRTEHIVSGSGNVRSVWVEQALPPNDTLAPAAHAIAPFPLPKIEKSSFQFWAFKPSADDVPTTASVAVQLALMPYHDVWRDSLGSAGVEASMLPPGTQFEGSGSLVPYMKAMRKLFLSRPALAARVAAIAEESQISSEARQAVRTLAALYGGLDERYTNYYGSPGTIPTIPYQELASTKELGEAGARPAIGATDTSNRLGGKTVFVGYSDLNSPDQPDRFHTVFTSDKGIDLSGLEIMATSFANLMTDSTISPLSPIEAALVVVLFGLIISQFVYWPAAYIAVPVAMVASAGYIYGAIQLFAGDNLWIPLAVPIAIQLPFAIVAGLLGQYVVERREKQRVGAAIANYLPDHLVRELTTGRVDANSFDKVVHGICLANDMSGFSGIAEHKSPAELATFMNSYFEAVAAALKKCEVDVTEFHADTIMCAWLGEPDAVDFRKNAIRAALEVVRSIEEFSASDPEVTLNARVGLQDGPFYLGHTGGGGRMSYSILGNPANAASRLEGLNKKLGTKILASSSVVTGLDDFATRPLGRFMVAGKSEIAEVVEIIGLTQEVDMPTQQLIDGFADALAAFLQEQWEPAGERFEQLVARFPKDGASRFYLGICQRYLAEDLPADEPTVLAMTEK